MLSTVLQVAFGGAIGASLRFLAGIGLARLASGGFPVVVMVVNILGSFLMGFFVIYAAQKELTHLNPFLLTGVLGGFTTFSAFSLDTVTLLERGEYGQAAVYIGVSVVGSILALVLGMALARVSYT